MAKLLMITGDRALAEGKRGAFYNTLEEFHKHWDRIDIICPGTKHKTQTTNYFGNVFIHPSPASLIFQPFWIFGRGINIYKEQKFDLMTVHEFPPFYNGIGARLLWQKIKVPYVVEIHHVPGYPRSAGIKEEVYKSLLRLFILHDVKKAKAVRVVNQSQVPKFLIESGVPKEKIIYIPSLYIDLDIFKPMNLQKEYDLIFVGRLEQNKGIDLFLEAVKKLNCKAIIVGDGSQKKDIQLQITNYKLPITFFGWAKDQKEIAELINKSKILVMPSYNEGGPRVVVEALACGVPVLATSVGIVPEVVEEAGAGVIIDWDSEDIVIKAENMLNDAEGYAKYSQAGVAVAQKFEKKAMIRNYAIRLQQLF